MFAIIVAVSNNFHIMYIKDGKEKYISNVLAINFYTLANWLLRKEEMNENVEKREAIINPEILPEKLSVIIKDEDGKLYESTKDNLRQKGYKIKELEFKKFINSDTDIQRQIEDIKTIRSEILENATAEIESIDFLQRASDNLRSKEDSNEELIELLLPSLLLLHMEMSSYLREEAEWSQLLNNKTALYVTGRTCDHGEYSVLYAILSTYYEMVLKNHIVFITEGNIK